MRPQQKKKSRTMFMHTLDGSPATYVEGYGGPIVGMVLKYRPARLVASRATIRRQQQRAMAQAASIGSPYRRADRYGYIRVLVPV